MQVTTQQIKQMLKEDEQLLATRRCSLITYIFSFTPRPGVLAATTERLMFVGDYLIQPGELVETYNYTTIQKFQLKSGLFNKRFSLKLKGDQVQFKYLSDSQPQAFIELVNAQRKHMI
ncbi:PH domain-containing protein [Pseudalkalibacillus sp. R45]|uniref:PH domain-containing protein n=1 Tax=Pseudalkalibacillus sp. R45 TaxID=3457433 RepID=UPI003FCC855B